MDGICPTGAREGRVEHTFLFLFCQRDLNIFLQGFEGGGANYMYYSLTSSLTHTKLPLFFKAQHTVFVTCTFRFITDHLDTYVSIWRFSVLKILIAVFSSIEYCFQKFEVETFEHKKIHRMLILDVFIFFFIVRLSLVCSQKINNCNYVVLFVQNKYHCF